MTDDELIAEVARVWVDGGGDAEGIDWCVYKIKTAVQAEIDSREPAPELFDGVNDALDELCNIRV